MANRETEDDGEIPRRLIRVGDISSPTDAERFLDAYLDREKDWLAAVGRASVFRISEFKRIYEGLLQDAIASQNVSLETSDEFIALFKREAKTIASLLHRQSENSWNETTYGIGQLNHALRGEGMRYDKAVITALALNRVAEGLGFEGTWSIPPHQIVACVFFFANLRGRLKKLSASKPGNEAEQYEAVLADLADATGQSTGVLNALAGKLPESETDADYEAAATTLGSFPTLFAIYQYLQRHQPDKKPNLEKIIVRRRVQGKKMKILKDEVIVPAGRITHGPYAWDKDGINDDREWPPLAGASAKNP